MKQFPDDTNPNFAPSGEAFPPTRIFRHGLLTLASSAGLFLFSIAVAEAQITVNVNNHSFESPDQGTGTGSQNPTDWTVSEPCNDGVFTEGRWDPPSQQHAGPSDGEQVMVLDKRQNGPHITTAKQTLGTVDALGVAGTQLNFTFDARFGSGNNNENLEIESVVFTAYWEVNGTRQPDVVTSPMGSVALGRIIPTWGELGAGPNPPPNPPEASPLNMTSFTVPLNTSGLAGTDELTIGFEHDVPGDGGNFNTRTFLDNVRVEAVAVELIELQLVSIDPVNVELQWNSLAGLSYNVLGSVGLPPGNPLPWTVYDGNGGILHNADEGTGDDDGDSSKTTVKVARPSEGDFYFAIASFPTPEQFAFEDDFDGADMGWVAGGTPGTGPTNWVEGTPGAPGPAAANSAPDCWGTNLTSDYGENADVILTSPSIDLTGASTAELRFLEWANIDNPDIGGFDVGSIEVLDADNADALLATIRPNTSNTTGWESDAIDLTLYVGGNIKIRYRLLTDNDGFVAPGWYIDDVQVAFTP